MATEIVVALISLCGILITGAVSIIASRAQGRAQQKELLNQMEHRSELQDVKIEAKLDRITAVTDTKLEELTREVRAHNGFAERIPTIEAQIKSLQQEVRSK